MFKVIYLMPQTVLFRFCMVCGKFMGIKDGRGVQGISHGICPHCLGVWKKKRRKKAA